MEDVLLVELEVERVVERLAHAHVGELRTARVEEEALRAGRAFVGQRVRNSRPSLTAGTS